MPWNPGMIQAASVGLLRAAQDGNFEPLAWNGGIQTEKDGGQAIYGCGWGQAAWFIAVNQGGVAYARRMLPVGAGQTQVNVVLKAAGLTRAEIKFMDPQGVWELFDDELSESYQNRTANPSMFIATSVRLAMFLIQVLEQIPETPVVAKRHERDFGRRLSQLFACLSPSKTELMSELESA